MDSGSSDLMNLELAREFQTAIVGIIGFIGVIAAQLLNAWLARRREDRTYFRRKFALEAAITAELKYILERIEETIALVLDKNMYESFKLPEIRRQIINEAYIGEIGLLSPEIIDVVMNGLMTVDRFERELNFDRTGNFKSIVVSDKSQALTSLRKGKRDINEAIRALSKNGYGKKNKVKKYT